MDDEKDTPIALVGIALIALVLFLGWAAMASAYDSSLGGEPALSDGSRRRSAAIAMFVSMLVSFVWNAFAYLPQFGAVFDHVFAEATIIPIATIVAVIVVGAFTLFMKSMEKQLAKPVGRPKKKRKKRRPVR